MSTYHTRLLERRARFVERWQTRLAGTQTAIQALSVERGRQDLLLQINKDFHQLSGAAGIYELHAICNDAIAAEDVCRALLKAGRAPDNEDVHSLRLFLSAIAEALQALKNEAVSNSRQHPNS